MRILIVLTYFQPHKSGLTVYAVLQAKALAERGHAVTVLTSQYTPDLPLEEEIDGVQVKRLPVSFHLSKGVIMPRMLVEAWKLVNEADVVNLHVPQMDAALVTLIAKLLGKPVVLTYHCDLQMPKGLINQIAGWAALVANRISAFMADVIVHNTRDFAEHSKFLSSYLEKLKVIQPPVVLPSITQAMIAEFKRKYQVRTDRPIIGMVSRLATEKGVEYLVEAMPMILEKIPTACVICVGEYQNVFGEEAYREKLLPMIEALGEHWSFLGVISETEKAVFYHLADVLVLPSINSTESFGMVQVEAMSTGTPVVATDLPGVRQPVRSTGMGQIVPPRDAAALARAISMVLQSNHEVDEMVIGRLIRYYSPESVADAYEEIFQTLVRENG